ncbi:MAG: 4'-phosphopantetheinyl transferase family protein [Pseudanabaena sp.]
MTTDWQLYQARLDISEIECDRLWKLLAEDERLRMARFKRENLRRNFVAARGNLRIILAQWLGCKPKEIVFGYSDRGKPYLQNSPSINQNIHFNLAHSQDLAIYAVSSDREVGIDLEYINPHCDIEGIAQRYFSPSEYKLIKEFGDRDPSLAVQAFYQAWTLKEAYGKATGQGIANILEGLDVSSLLGVAIGATLQIGDWNLKLLSTELELGTSYAAALCIQ